MDNRQIFIDAQNYFIGDGGRHRDRRHAVQLLYQVYESLPPAARLLGICLETGDSVAMDLNEARRLYRIAGDAAGVARVDLKLQYPGSDGFSVPGAPRAVQRQEPPRSLRPAAPVFRPAVHPPPLVREQNIAPAPRPCPAAQPVVKTCPLPLHIERIVLKDAERNGYVCSIAFECVTEANGVVTSCGHIFLRSSIVDWMKQSKHCPECRCEFAIGKEA